MKKENWGVVFSILAIIIILGALLAFALHLDNKSAEEISKTYMESAYVTQQPFNRTDLKTNKAKEDVLAISKINKSDIDTKIGYMQYYINNIKSSQEDAESYLYQSAYLMYLPLKAEALADNDIVALGKMAYTYAKDIYTNVEDKDSTTSQTRRKDIQAMLEKISPVQEELISKIITEINQ